MQLREDMKPRRQVPSESTISLQASSWEAQLGAELDLTALPAFLCEETTSTREIWEFGWFWGMVPGLSTRRS